MQFHPKWKISNGFHSLWCKYGFNIHLKVSFVDIESTGVYIRSYLVQIWSSVLVAQQVSNMKVINEAVLCIIENEMIILSNGISLKNDT